MRQRYLAAMLASTAAIVIPAQAARAQEAERNYEIGSQPLDDALRLYSEVSGREVVASSTLIEGKLSSRVTGRFAPRTALDRLLVGTGLIAEAVNGAFVIHPGKVNAKVGETRPGDETIIVTGTRLRGTGPVGSPVTTVDRETLDRSGRATLADYIRTIPQNFAGGPTEANVGYSARGYANSNLSYGTGINLRGLGSGSTLTLFDGMRPALGGSSGAFTDLSLIPSAAIDRIEILTDGASAIYGSDAIAGVVNVRFRNGFEGYETRLRAGTADGDFGEYQASQIFGTKWSSGHVVIAGEYYRRGNLPSSQRRFASEDLRPFGGPDLRSNFASPGTIVAANGQRYRIPAGQDGTSLTPADLIASNTFNRGDMQRHFDLLPNQEGLSLYASGEHRIGEHVTLFARGLYANRRYHARQRVFGPLAVAVSPANPYYVDPIGTDENITVYYDPAADFGPEGVRGKARAINSAFGARTDVGAWSFELSAGYGLQREASDAFGVVNRLKLSRAALASDPAEAFNPLGEGPVNDPALIERLRGGLAVRTHYEVWTAAGRADGTLFSVPAGEVKAALGVEYRRDRLRYAQTIDRSSDEPITLGVPGLPDRRIVRALYGELVLPVFDAGPHFPGSLTLSAAGRYEDYSDVGDTANPKFGVGWSPLPGLGLRASYGRSFRAPFFDELVGAANALNQTIALPDPRSPTGQTVVIALLGFRPDLGPEKAETWTAGLDFEPRFLPGAKLTLTYFDIRYRDRIGSANFDLFNFLIRRDLYGAIVSDNPAPAAVAALYAGPNFANPAGYSQSQIGAIIDARTFNLSRATVRGLDFDLGMVRPLGAGRISLSLGGTRLLEIDSRITDSAPRNNVVGVIGNPVRLRLRGRAGFTIGAFDGGLGINHVGGYRNTLVAPAERVKSWTTFDLQLGARIGKVKGRSLRFALNVNNLTDKAPPYVQFRTTNSALGYDPEQANAIGRTMALQAVVAW